MQPAFGRDMQSTLVAKARLLGWMPLFIIKNAIVQNTNNFGINKTQVSAMNLQPKSCLALIGFVKGKPPNVKIISCTNDEGNLMVLPNQICV